MFFFTWLLGSWVRMLIGLATFIVIAVIIFAVVNVLLAFAGGVDACTPGGGPIAVNAASAQSFDDSWDQLDTALDAGNPATVAFDESQVSSRAQTFMEEEDAPFDDVRVCIHGGFGEATATLDAVLGLNADVKVKGSVDLTGEHPEAQIEDVEIGNVPGFVTGLIEGIVESAIEDALDDIALEHTYAPTLLEGRAQIDGQP